MVDFGKYQTEHTFRGMCFVSGKYDKYKQILVYEIVFIDYNVNPKIYTDVSNTYLHSEAYNLTTYASTPWH